MIDAAAARDRIEAMSRGELVTVWAWHRFGHWVAMTGGADDAAAWVAEMSAPFPLMRWESRAVGFVVRRGAGMLIFGRPLSDWTPMCNHDMREPWRLAWQRLLSERYADDSGESATVEYAVSDR